MKRLLLLLLALPSLALAHDDTPFGRQGDPNAVRRTIDVDMSDSMRFSPAELTVREGETIQFRVKNSGKAQHEMVLGTLESLKAHAGMMKKHPGMEHDDPYAAHVPPGKTGTFVWQFTKAGEFYYGCLVPGHFEAGMLGKVRVTSARSGYAGEEARAVKALPADEVKQYLAGAGMGYAKSAELNHHPGPMHSLELADSLELSEEQRTRARELMDAHKAEARAIGARLVDAERALEALFRSGNVTQAALKDAVRTTAALQGEYRLAHLETHRRMRALLSDEQVRNYDALRGYAKGADRRQHRHDHGS